MGGWILFTLIPSNRVNVRLDCRHFLGGDLRKKCKREEKREKSKDVNFLKEMNGFNPLTEEEGCWTCPCGVSP